MWEFSLNLLDSNFPLAGQIYKNIKSYCSHTDGFVTSHEGNGYINILVGVEEKNRQEIECFLTRYLTQVICSNFKAKFLDENLILPDHDKIGIIAFKKALLNFDRETDYYIIQRALNFDKDIFLESFYEFKLRNLKAKWVELVGLANENRDYLISNESFLDLLKFLIDNLDICEEEVDIVEEENGFKIILNDEQTAENDYKDEILSEESLISSIIDLSPQHINMYCNGANKATKLLETIFKERIKVFAQEGVLKEFKNCK